FSDLVMSPSDHNVLYVAVGNYFGDATNGVYQSIDAGANWLPAGNFAAAAGGSSVIGRIALAIAPSNASVLYAAVTNSSSYGLQSIVVSTNGGATWSPTAAQPSNYQGGQGWYDTTIAVSPTDSGLVYVAGAA